MTPFSVKKLSLWKLLDHPCILQGKPRITEKRNGPCMYQQLWWSYPFIHHLKAYDHRWRWKWLQGSKKKLQHSISCMNLHFKFLRCLKFLDQGKWFFSNLQGTIHPFLTENTILRHGGANPHPGHFTLGCQLKSMYSWGHRLTEPAEPHHWWKKAVMESWGHPIGSFQTSVH